MPPTVSTEALRQAAAEYATGLATLDRRLRELAEERERLVADRRVTLGAKFAIDRLLEALEDKPAAAPAPQLASTAPAATTPPTPEPAPAAAARR